MAGPLSLLILFCWQCPQLKFEVSCMASIWTRRSYYVSTIDLVTVTGGLSWTPLSLPIPPPPRVLTSSKNMFIVWLITERGSKGSAYWIFEGDGVHRDRFLKEYGRSFLLLPHHKLGLLNTRIIVLLYCCIVALLLVSICEMAVEAVAAVCRH